MESLLNNLTDNELLSLLSKGDEIAFDVLFKRHHRAMYLYANKLLKDSDVAADIVQSVFVRLWENKGFILNINIKSYLYSMVRNMVINYIRDNRNHLIHNYRIIMENDQSQEIDEMNLMEELARHEELQKAIQSLPIQQRKILLSRFDGKSNKQIAEEENLSINTVKVHLRLGMIKLKKNLGIIIISLIFLL